jgi:dCMP deaminase
MITKEIDKPTTKLGLLKLALQASHNSRDPHRQVGCILLLKRAKGFTILSGYNQLAPCCHHLSYKDDNGKTRPEVIHAEMAVLSELMRTKHNTADAKAHMYSTLSPCMECARLMVMADIKSLTYIEDYKDKDPVKFLLQHNIKVEQVTIKP